jgi:hypothetical protein
MVWTTLHRSNGVNLRPTSCPSHTLCCRLGCAYRTLGGTDEGYPGVAEVREKRECVLVETVHVRVRVTCARVCVCV